MIGNGPMSVKLYCGIIFCIICKAYAGNAQHFKNLPSDSDLSETKITIDNSHGIVGAFVFPHGGITVDPENRDYSKESASGENTKEESLKLNRAMKKAAQDLVRKKPDLIVFTTPHGLLLQNHFLFVGNGHTEGSFEDGKYSASFNLDELSTITIYKSLLNLSNPVELITLGLEQETMPIRWAEVIPWIFLKEAADKENFILPPVVLIGVPFQKNISHPIKLGNDIYTVIRSNAILSRKRVAIVISCDLSHYHSNAMSSPYPYSKYAQPFDDFCVEWAKLDRNIETEDNSTDILIHQAGDIANSAGSCGYYSLVILHGILSQAVKNGDEYQSVFFEYSAPSYFGMMVASWVR